MIEFLCPNGHRIHCPEDQAGRAAQCPRCGVKFRIPDPSEAVIPESSPGDSDSSGPELADSEISTDPPNGPRRAPHRQSQIEFLCPNGHRLHGAASLQGRGGECPECGSKFRIPTYDDVSEEEETDAEIGMGRADGGRADGGVESGTELADAAVSNDAVSKHAVSRDAGEIAEPCEQDRAAQEAELAEADIEQVAGRHPLARLFCKLWAQKPAGAAVELHLTGGETLLPDRFAPALSQGSHGTFAVRESGGTYTLTVVAWDSIVRVLLRGVGELPEEMSD